MNCFDNILDILIFPDFRLTISFVKWSYVSAVPEGNEYLTTITMYYTAVPWEKAVSHIDVILRKWEISTLLSYVLNMPKSTNSPTLINKNHFLQNNWTILIEYKEKVEFRAVEKILNNCTDKGNEIHR